MRAVCSDPALQVLDLERGISAAVGIA